MCSHQVCPVVELGHPDPSAMQTSLADTPRIGLWIDSTGMTAEETVESILSNDMKGSLLPDGNVAEII